MENRIPIDQLFHDKLAEGREQLNLGAWANMERMLDGKNPYINDEKQKRRGLWPLLLTLLITTGVLGTGYLIRQSASHQSTAGRAKSSDFQQDRPVVAKVSSSHVAHDESEVSTLDNKQKSNTTSNAVKPARQSRQQPVKSRESGIASSSKAINGTQQTSDNPSQESTNTNSSSNNTSNSASSDQSDAVTKMPKQLTSNKTAARQKRKAFKLNHKSTSNTQVSQQTTSESDLNESTLTDQLNAEPTITQMPVVSLKQSEVRDRSGKLISTIEDTIGKSVLETVNEASAFSSETASLSYTETNPRFKKLSAEDDLLASVRSSEVPAAKPQPSASNVVADATASASNSKEVSSQSVKKSVAKQGGYFDDLRNFGVQTYQRITNYFQSRPKPNWYNGVSMGMNMSLSNSTHNFGGFHAGFTNLMPLSDYFSVVSEFKFFYRNNGGYTVNDIAYRILNPTVDNVTLPHQVIYGYQKDSTVRTYNFRNFYSLELPVMMQFNYRSLALYGGINLAYNFKLKTTEKSRNYVVNVTDTVSNALAYSYPAEKASIVERSDFGPRLGLGYTVGASYNFNPQIYLDIRLTQNVLDNMRTNAAREISNGFFKVPTMQLSFGYRFRKFSPDN